MSMLLDAPLSLPGSRPIDLLNWNFSVVSPQRVAATQPKRQSLTQVA